MTWTLRKRLAGAFIALQVLAVGVAAILAFLGWKGVQHIRHVREVAWPATNAAMEIRILNQNEELAMGWSHWKSGSGRVEFESIRTDREGLYGTLRTSGIVAQDKLRQMEDLERLRHEQVESMWPLLEEMATDQENPEYVRRHREAMSDLASVTVGMDALLVEIERDIESEMDRLTRLVALYADVGIGVLAVLAVVMLGLMELFRRMVQRSVTEPVERMVADLEAIEGHGRGHRLSIPQVPELGLLAGAINRSLERLEVQEAERRQMDRSLIRAERMASVGTVASGIVHNLKNPLTVISGLGQILQSTQPDLKEAGMIFEAAREMNGMVEDILARGRQVKAPEPVDLNSILRRELDFLNADLMFKHEVDTEVRLAEDLLPIEGIPTDFSQIFGNLLHNAVDAMRGREVKHLTVVTSCDGESATVEVTDTGCGIPEPDIPRLFDPFFTTKAAEAEGKGPVGTGLGLYTVQRLLEPYGATVELESTVDVGTSFRVRIPILREREENAG